MLKGTGAPNAGLPPSQASTDISGTPGSGTSNTPTGRFAIPAASASVTISCNICTVNTRVHIQVESNDATLKSCSVQQPGNGAFTVTGNVAATGNCNCNYMLIG